MKKLFSVCLLAFATFSLAMSPIAEAKRFGGGKSFGKSFKTAPAPKKTQQNTDSINKSGTTQTPKKSGLMGGLMGGLLAGGLLAAFFGGAFEGIQFMDILIIGLVAFFVIRMLRGMLGQKAASMNQHREAYSGPQNQGFKESAQQPFQQPNTAGGFGASAKSDVPHNYPPGFDQTAFINGSREHYRILQGAWNHNELHTIKEYVSDSLYADLVEERASLDGEQHTDVMFVDAEIVRADYDANKAQLSLQFTGRYRDAAEGIEEDINDIWHLERDLTIDNAPWLIIGIQG